MMKHKTKKRLRQVISTVLITAMLLPDTAALVSYGQYWLNNRPRTVDFSRPQPLTLAELELASGSNTSNVVVTDQTADDKNTVTASSSNATLREPEFYYDVEPDEPDGELVQFTDSYRTYQIDEGVYTTVFGGYSGYYEDEDGTLWMVDNTFTLDGGRSTSGAKTEAEDEEEDDPYADGELINDLGTFLNDRRTWARTAAATASSSNASQQPRSVSAYENRAGAMQVSIPKEITRSEGIRISGKGYEMELIPTEGDFSRSMAMDNAVRFTDVFEHIDYQYTMLGKVVKEDIILMEPTDRHSFSFRLKLDGQRAVQNGNYIEIRDPDSGETLFFLEAPSMTDAEGERSLDLRLKLSGSSGSYTVTVTADEEWLLDADRAYPVRIDPAPGIPADEFLMVMVSEGLPKTYFGWGQTPMVGYVEGKHKNSRVFLAFNELNDQYMREIVTGATACLEAELTVTTMTNNSNGDTPIQLYAPIGAWNARNLVWDRMPALSSIPEQIQTGHPAGIDQPISYDITSILNGWIAGTQLQAGFMLRTDVEAEDDGVSSGHRRTPEALYSQTDANYGPKITVTWEGELPDGADLAGRTPDDITVLVDPAMEATKIDGRTVSGVITHGLAQAGADVFYTLIQEGEDIEEWQTPAESSLTYIDFAVAGLESAKTPVKKSNWQSDGFEVSIGAPLELDTIYQYRAYAVGQPLDEDGEVDEDAEPVEGTPKPSDRFLLYEVQQHDLVKRIARHYGVNPNQIARDNQLIDNQLTEAQTILFIRNPEKSEPYSPAPMTPQDQLILDSLLLGFNPECELDLEPVNMNTGNFVMQQTDSSLEELNGIVSIQRNYNSQDNEYRSAFGMGWCSPLEAHLTVLPDGRVLYKRGDGAGIVFQKDGDTWLGPDGRDTILETMDSLDIIIDDEDDDEDETAEETEEGTNPDDEDVSGEEETAGRLGRSSRLSDFTTMDTEYEDDGDGSDGEEEAEVTKLENPAGWKMTDLDGTVHVFDALGFLQYIENRKGHRTTYIYNNDYELRKIETATGKVFEFTMDEDYQITEISLPDGGTLSYEYDDDRNLISATNPNGQNRRYEYDQNHRMTAWYDEDGTRITANHYDDEGRVVVQTDANGDTAYLDYQGTETRMTDNRGNVTIYHYDDQNRSVGITYPDGSRTGKRYDENGRLASKTDEEGNTTSYTYDERGNVIREHRADGADAVFAYDEENRLLSARDYNGCTTRFTYDDNGNMLSMTDGAGNTTRYDYDEENRLTTLTDGRGNSNHYSYDGAAVTSLRDGEGNTWSFSYDGMYRMTAQTDPLGNTTTYEYDDKGRKLSETAADGGTTTYEYDDAGNVLAITDANGVLTSFTYDEMYNILSGEDALGATLTYTYDENYNRISETDAKGNVTGYHYDSKNRLTGITDAMGQEISYELDRNGNIIRTTDRRGNETTITYDTVLGLPVSETDALGHTTSYSYDKNGNRTAVSYPDGSLETYRYDGAGRMTYMQAKNGLETRITYDGAGNITRITDDDTRIFQFRYNGNNQVSESIDPLGNATRYHYDGTGRQTGMTDARGSQTSYEFDAVGRLIQVQDALNGTAAVTYDKMGRVLSETDQNGHGTSYYYDVIGQLLAREDAAGSVTAIEYDMLGNVTKQTDALKGETTFELDSLGRTVTKTDAMGGVYEYRYDENGNLLSILLPDGDRISMSYDAKNQLTHLRDEADVVTRYEYDSMGRITLAVDTIGNRMEYEYDESGNLIRQTDTIGRDAIYEYDRFGHLVSVTGTDLATTRYTYDPLDRLTSVTQADNTVTTYEYDEVGNLIRMTEPGEAVYTYAYDAINRLTGEVNPLGAATAFQYDAKGNLTETTDAENNTTHYVYDEIDRMIRQRDGRGNDTVYDYDELSRLIAHTTAEGSLREYRYDSLGRMTKEKDANGLITEHVYDSMGNRLQSISPKGLVTAYTYDKHDEVTGIKDTVGNQTLYEVDLNRRVTQMTQKNGGVYTYTYDAVHRLTGMTTPLGFERQFTYDVADNIIQETDNLGRTSSFEYDIMHRMTKTVDAEGGVTAYGYDIRGNQNQLTNALGYTWNYQYDLVDQLTASVDPEGKATGTVYNLVGELSEVTKPGGRTTRYSYDGNYNATAITDPKGYVYAYTYDKDNRLIEAKDPLGQTEQTAYDPGSRLTSVTDKMGLTERYAYDPHGNVLKVTGTSGLNTWFDYDVLDNLIKVTMPSNLKATYTYDVMGNRTSDTDTMGRTTSYTYDLEGNMTSLTDASGRTEQMGYDVAGRLTSHQSNAGNKISYDYDKLNNLIEKAYEDQRDPNGEEGVIYAYDALGQRTSMMNRSGESKYEYDGLGRITKVTTGSGEVTSYAYDGSDQLKSITYPDGKKVSYEYDKNDNLTKVIDRDGSETVYQYDAINRVTEVIRPNGVTTYNTYNARDQIVILKNICVDCDWVISEYHYTYDDRGFIVGEDVIESLAGYAWDDKHDGKHENGRHDHYYPHGGQHTGKHDKDGEYHFQIIETNRTFAYDDDGKLLKATEKEERQGTYVYTFQYDDMGNRLKYAKTRNGILAESAEYTYNQSNQMTAAKIYDGKKNTNMKYEYDADGNRISETGKVGTDKVELTYLYTVENRLKAIYDADELLVAMAYDGDGNRIFQLNYNLHTDDDWKGNSGNGNGNNKDNSGSGNSGNGSGSTGTGSTEAETENGNSGNGNSGNGNSGNGNSGNQNNNGNGNTNGNNGNHYGWANGNNGNGNNGNGNDGNGNSNNNGNGSETETGAETDNNTDNTNTSTGTGNDNNGNANGNTNNTGGSQNQSGILFPIDGEVSELEEELIGMIKTTGKHKNYELMEYVNDVNREHVEVLQELNINGIMDTSYTYGNERLTNERFTGEVGSYLYDPRGSVSGLTDEGGMLWQSYRYDPFGNIDFGKPDHNNIYAYNAENYNGNTEHQYLRARYYDTDTADFLTEDSYLGEVKDPLSLNRYNYVKSSPLNYTDPSGHWTNPLTAVKNAAQSAFDQLKAFVEQYISIDGNIVTITIGAGDSSLTTKIEMAEGLSATEICELAISFAIGAVIQNGQFYHILGPTAFIGGLPNKWILDFITWSGAEDYLVEHFLNSQMYYLGKYASALYNVMVANTVLSVSSSVMNKAKDLLDNSSQQLLDSTPGLKQNQMGASAGVLAGAALTKETITALIAEEGAGISSLLGGIEITLIIAGAAVTTVLMAGENSAMGQTYLESSREKIEAADAIAVDLGDIAGKYKDQEKCDKAAEEMAIYLDGRKVEYEWVTINYSVKAGMYSITYNKRISSTGMHCGIYVKELDKIFCNWHLLGLPPFQWVNDFEGRGIRSVTPIKFNYPQQIYYP